MSATVTYKGSTLTTVHNATKTLNTAGTWVEDDITIVDDSTSNLQSKTINSSTSTQTVTPDSGYDGLSSVTVNAIATGTAGTPTATKGTVSNYSVSVTPSVTNTTGYITGGTKTGTAVTVSASELVSGTKSITGNATGIDVTNYASVDVNVTTKYTATITVASVGYGYVTYKNTNYTSGTFEFEAGQNLSIRANQNAHTDVAEISINGTIVKTSHSSYTTYDWTLQDSDIEISFSNGLVAITQPMLSITSNGTYDVTEYAFADVDIEGVDIPIFNINFNSDWEVTSATCNKTFSECYAIYEERWKGEGYYYFTIDYGDGTIDHRQGTLTMCDASSNQIIYTDFDFAAQPSSDIIYNSNGTIEWTSPSIYNLELNATSNGYYYPPNNKGVYTNVYVNVPSSINNQNKSVTPTESAQTVTADSGYTGLGTVSVGAISSTYVGSGIDRRTSSNLTASGATVTVPAGFYESQASKSVASGSATTPATTITANPSISVSSSGLITATTSASQNITPTVSAGYVSTGTAGTVTVSGSKTQQLTTKGATTYNTSTTDQTITSGTYLTGTQTIKAVQVSGLDASKIASGTTITVGDANDVDRIASVTGTFTSDATAEAADIVDGETAYVNGRLVEGKLVINNYYTGSSAPSSSLGQDGDIYFQS